MQKPFHLALSITLESRSVDLSFQTDLELLSRWRFGED